ncbi:tRNA (adenosine(37)-N6)-threonylcarbamoyltransferase complex ATPase subunit type 1 TsaE [Candidatus Peregrinibacteria bacterium]|nr:tRNA (adenosine(37)-N6)-threonylcarbamoyltransferase complex ATPase subunit type 1 TsaE [Candidatus Peregrinibacteria bacterium]
MMPKKYDFGNKNEKIRAKTLTTNSPKETKILGKKILLKHPFHRVICLYGELGAGKTTLVQGMAESLGIEKVKSPTYALIREYFGKKKLIHMDFYRMETQNELETFGLNDFLEEKNSIIIIEWADRLGENLPKKRLDIVIKHKKDNQRQFMLHEVTPFQESDVKKLYFEYATPKHIQNHCRKVTEVAMYLAKKMQKKGIKIDFHDLKIAGLLHDVLRMCDVQNFHMKKSLKNVVSSRNCRSKQIFKSFQNTRDEPSPRDKKIWSELRKKYKKMGHEEATYQILKKKGEKTIATIIRKHKFSTLLNPKTAPKTWEEKLLYYADKRVIHERITSVEERLHDGRIRYAKTPEEEQKSRKIEPKLLDLERKIFEIIGENPNVLVKKLSTKKDKHLQTLKRRIRKNTLNKL